MASNSSGRSGSCAGNWLTKIQGVSLVILDHELARRPRRLLQLTLETYTGLAQTIGGRGDVVRLKVQMEMATVIHERNRRIHFVDLLQMNDVSARAHARVKVVV